MPNNNVSMNKLTNWDTPNLDNNEDEIKWPTAFVDKTIVLITFLNAFLDTHNEWKTKIGGFHPFNEMSKLWMKNECSWNLIHDDI
jgi:hypothetical protein